MVKFSNSLAERVTQLDPIISPDVIDNELVMYTTYITYLLFEGEQPSTEWFDAFEKTGLSIENLLSSYINDFPESKYVAALRSTARVQKTPAIPRRKNISTSNAPSLVYSFYNEGTPTWFVLMQNSVSSSIVGRGAVLSVVGSIGVDSDLYITKSPLTRYSEIGLGDIVLDYRDLE